MVRFLVNVEWDVSWFGVRHVFTVGEVERDVDEVDSGGWKLTINRLAKKDEKKGTRT